MSASSASQRTTLPTEEEIRANFAPAQAEILLRVIATPQQEERHLSMGEAAERAGWTYDTFRKEQAFDLANVAPQGKRKRYAVSRLLRIAENLRKGSLP